jgi:hypothetical protein
MDPIRDTCGDRLGRVAPQRAIQRPASVEARMEDTVRLTCLWPAALERQP